MLHKILWEDRRPSGEARSLSRLGLP